MESNERTAMKALDIANMFVQRHGEAQITNLKLNKLVYLAQEESLRCDGIALFEDDIEAWQYGPVVRSVYNEFKKFGRAPIAKPSRAVQGNAHAERIVDATAAKYSKLTAFDLVNVTHAKGGAWERAYSPGCDNVITLDTIRSSLESNIKGKTLADGIETVEATWPNALKMLETR